MPPDHRAHLAACVTEGRFTPAEADLILDYMAEYAARVGSLQKTRNNHYHNLQRAACVLHDTTGHALDTCTTADVLATVTAIRERDGSPNYARTQVRIFRAFCVWLAKRRPELDGALIASVKLPPARWKNRRPEDMLTRDEVVQIIDACDRARDKAVIAMLYDGSNRPSELLKLDWRDLHGDAYGVWFSTSGKTGRARRIRLTGAVPYVAAWKALYPGGAEPEKPVFCKLQRPYNRMTTGALNNLIDNLRERTGIARITAYLFRPSRITHDVEDHMPSSYISLKNWGSLKTPMLDLYVNTDEHFIDRTALEAAGIRPREATATANPLVPIECPRCHTLNPPGARGCMHCFEPLTPEARAEMALAEEDIEANPEEVIRLLQRYLAQRGAGK